MTRRFGCAVSAALLGLLALVLPAARGARAASDVEATQAQLRSICDALKKTSGQACGARARAPGAEPTPMSSEVSTAPPLDQPAERPLVRPVDAWGRAVRISVDSGDINLQSAGPDGEFGTADDIALRCPTAK
jgi:hypothetical protein